MKRAGLRAGFTLLETLVAFVILTLTIGLLYRGLFDATGGVADEITRYEATEYATSVMELFRATYHTGTFATSGQHGRLAYTLTLAPYPEAEVPRAYAQVAALWHVTLEVEDETGQRLARLTSLYLEPLK